MRSQGIHSGAVETPVRKLRTFLVDLMETAGDNRPAISQKIRDTRKRLHDEWKADHPGEKDNPFTQEAVARRVPVTLGAYGAWERGKIEPSLQRLRQVAVALGLDEDYFSPSGDLASATARLEAEADRLAEIRQGLEQLLPVLQSHAREQEPPDSQTAPD